MFKPIGSNQHITKPISSLANMHKSMFVFVLATSAPVNRKVMHWQILREDAGTVQNVSGSFGEVYYFSFFLFSCGGRCGDQFGTLLGVGLSYAGIGEMIRTFLERTNL